MSFVNKSMVDAGAALKSAHFPFPRAEELRDAMVWCVTDYYTKTQSGKTFEARGLMVTGETRQGKSKEISRMIEKFNDGSTIMPDGRPGIFVECVLSGEVSWKNLGAKILDKLEYPLKGRRDQDEIWREVRKKAKLQGVVGIHFDECQHVFAQTGSAHNQKILDCFKTLLKEPSWPLMIILSGIPNLASYVAKEPQLEYLLRKIRFNGININDEKDKEELLQLTFGYAETAELDFSHLATPDFLERLAFAGNFRWGLVIELLIEALTNARVKGDKQCKTQHFDHAFGEKYTTPMGYSPFSIKNYRDHFDPEKLMQILKKAN